MSQSPPELSSDQHHFSVVYTLSGHGCSVIAWVGIALALAGVVLTAIGIWVTIALAKGWI
jgi:hypothetical protein